MEYTQEERAYVMLSSVDGIGPATVEALLQRFSSPTEVLENVEEAAREFRLKEPVKQALYQRARPAFQEAYFRRLDQMGIFAVSRISAYYPQRLRLLSRMPVTLYAMGDLRLLNPERAIAIVGTRHPSRYGRRMAVEIAGDLARAGVTVVSGLARGIDGYGHAGCLQAGGDTIAVLGSGVNVPYPRENEGLYREIAQRGVLVSEFLPGAAPNPRHFPSRNRIISGLSDGVLVVEAGERSGSSITVDHANDQGREVFAVPGPADAEQSYTTNLLIKEGAGMVLGAQDVLTGMGWDGARRKPPRKVAEEALLSDEEALIVGFLREGELSRDALYDRTDFSMPQLSQILMELVSRGIIEELPRNMYTLGGK